MPFFWTLRLDWSIVFSRGARSMEHLAKNDDRSFASAQVYYRGTGRVVPLYAGQKYDEHCLACAVAALWGTDRRLGAVYYFTRLCFAFCGNVPAATTPKRRTACLFSSVCCQSVMLFLSTRMPDPVVSAFVAGFFLPVDRAVRPRQPPGAASERERAESASTAHLHSVADRGRAYNGSFICPPRLGACTAFAAFAVALLLGISLRGYGAQ